MLERRRPFERAGAASCCPTAFSRRARAPHPGADYPDAAVLIADLAEQSRQAGRTPLVYLGAPWCEPCRYFHAAAEAGQLDAEFPDLDLLVFDDDRDAARLQAAGYGSRYIPLLAVPGPDGRGTAKQIEGSIKGPGAVAQITPRLKALPGR